MTERRDKPDRKAAARSERAERLAAALRDNLRKRKSQARERRDRDGAAKPGGRTGEPDKT